jgi:uncharacterized phage-associated protein
MFVQAIAQRSAMVAPIDVARYLIHLATPNDEEDADCLCHMRLQKLLYYVQGWHLASAGAPLFHGRIEAWKFGPVVEELYPVFKAYGYAIPPSEGADPPTLTGKQKAFIKSVWDRYKRFSATALRDMTHQEQPWLDARGGIPADVRSNSEITVPAMRAYFAQKLAERLKRYDARINPAMWVATAEAIATGRVRTTQEVRREFRHHRTGPDPG